MIGGYHAVATHLRTLMVAVGLGNFDLACTGSFPGAISCEDYKWTVPEDGVVLVYRMEEWPQGPIEPYPTPSVEPGDHWVEIDGRTALFSQAGDGIMRWDMLGTPEVIEARFGSGVANTAPQEIQAVIDSWHWTTPTATPPPTPIVTGTGSDAYSWQKVGATQAGIFPTWAPDSGHIVINMEAANEYNQFDLIDRAGVSLAHWSALTRMFWLNSDVAQGYEADSVPPYQEWDQYQMVPGRSFSVSDPTPASVTLPCCMPLSNGHGAISITRLLPDKVRDLPRPRFVVWHDGVESDEHDGEPIAWNLAGDKLIVIHPTQPEGHGLPEGWLEVLSWPDLATVFQGDPNEVIGDASFDPTGNYVTYELVFPDASNVWHLEIHIIDLGSGSTAKIPFPGDSSKMGVGSWAWNDQGQILVMSAVNLTLSTDLPDGTTVKQDKLSQPTWLQGSANGATILTTVDDEIDNPSHYQVIRDGVSQPVTLPFDGVTGFSLSPDGSQIFGTGYSETDKAVVGYLADIP